MKVLDSATKMKKDIAVIVKIVVCFTTAVMLLIQPVTDPRWGARTVISQNADDQDDAGSGTDAPDLKDEALSINQSILHTGQIGASFVNAESTSDSRDYYEVTLSSSGMLSVEFQVTSVAESSLTSVSIWKDGNQVAAQNMGNNDPLFNLVVPILSGGTCQLEIITYNELVEYEFKAELEEGTPPEQTDAGQDGDAGDWDDPREIDLDVDHSGQIGNGAVDDNGRLDMEDAYSMILPDQGYLDVDLQMSSPDSNWNLYASVFTDTWDLIFMDSITDNEQVIQYAAPIAEGGEYRVSITTCNWNVTYEFRLSFRSEVLPPQNDGGLVGDASELYEEASTIDVNSTISGTVGHGLLDVSDGLLDTSDFYKLPELPEGNLHLSIRILNEDENSRSIYLKFYNNSDSSMQLHMSLYACSFSPKCSSEVFIETGDQYFLEAYASCMNVSYEIDVLFVEETAPQTTTGAATSTTSTKSSDSESTNTVSFSSVTVAIVILVGVAVLTIRQKRSHAH